MIHVSCVCERVNVCMPRSVSLSLVYFICVCVCVCVCDCEGGPNAEFTCIMVLFFLEELEENCTVYNYSQISQNNLFLKVFL